LFMIVAAGAAYGVAALGTTATAASGGLLSFGAAALMVGAGIGIAGAGIGYMANGLATLVNSGKGAGDSLLNIAGGILAINGALASSIVGGFGLPVFAATLGVITSQAPKLEKIGNAFASIQAVLSGTKEDFVAVENAIASISNANVKGGGIFKELSNLLSKPLKVEFVNGGKVNLQNDITLEINGEKFMRKVYNANVAVQTTNALQSAKGGLV